MSSSPFRIRYVAFTRPGLSLRASSLTHNLCRHSCKFGMLSAKANAAGMIVFFFVLYSSYALAFFQGTRYILSGQATPGNVLVVIFSIMSGAMGLVVIAPNLMAVAHGQSAATSIYKTIDRKPKYVINSNTVSFLCSHDLAYDTGSTLPPPMA